MTTSEKINVVIPMAGRGSRFSAEGYETPKPFIDICGKMMIQRVVEKIDVPNAHFIFICLKEHLTPDRENVLRSLSASNEIVSIDGYTRGTAETVVIGTANIEMSAQTYIVNSDQLVEWNHYDLTKDCPDGALVCFEGTGANWSYVRLDSNNEKVVEVAEKRRISNIATAGVYYWKSGKDFTKYAKQMIAKNLTVNNEFYVAPVYQEAIADRKSITILPSLSLEQLGTPSELKEYLRSLQTCNIYTVT